MPLNMNTVGTGTGIGDESSNNLGILMFPSEINPQYSASIPAYYIKDYSSCVPENTTNYVLCNSVSQSIQRIFLFKNELYAVVLDPNGQYKTGHGGTVTYDEAKLAKVNISGKSVTLTQLYTFRVAACENQYSTNPACEPYGYRHLVYPGKDYIYFVSYDSIKTTSGDNTYTRMNTNIHRFDGTRSEIILTLYGYDSSDKDISITSSFIDMFTMIDPDKEDFLLLTGGYFYKIDTSVNPPSCKKMKITANAGYCYGTNHTYTQTVSAYIDGSTKSTAASLASASINKNKGTMSFSLYSSSNDTNFGFFVSFKYQETDDKFTITNIQSYGGYQSSYIGNRSDVGIDTYTTADNALYKYGRIGPVEFMLYNPLTKQTEIKLYTSEPNTKYKFGPSITKSSLSYGETAGLAVSVADRINGRLIWAGCNTGITYFGYQPCSFTYVTEYSDVPSSSIDTYLVSGDIVYASTPITEYKEYSASGFTCINNPSNKFKIQKDGHYVIKSTYESGSPKPSWIVLSVTNTFKYIDVYKVSTTQIHGKLIRGMIINGVSVTSDGEQDITLPDFSTSGLLISMKGVN